jgi:hypothetical protein
VARVTERVRAAFAASDAVLTIGGVSAGDYDPVKLALETLGNIELWRVAMRPGRPQAFGTPGGKLFFGLPGNPASVACVFEVLVRPALRAMQGHAIPDRPRVPVRVGATVESRAGRTDFVRSSGAMARCGPRRWARRSPGTWCRKPKPTRCWWCRRPPNGCTRAMSRRRSCGGWWGHDRFTPARELQ